MAGMAATASTPKSAANNINFLNLLASFCKRVRLLPEAIAPLRPRSYLAGAGGRCGLVDLLVARSSVRGAHGNGRADLLELKLISGGAVLEDVGHVLSVASVANTLDIGALGGVVALLGGREVLAKLGALAFLLLLLANLGYGRDGSHRQHRQKRRQQH